MIQLAFKIAAKTSSPWSELIARQSGSIYSHVEGWLSGPQNNAYCFSSREPKGAGFEYIDLTTGEWDIFPVNGLTDNQEARTWGYCFGAQGKRYDGLGLIGYKVANPAIHDPSAIFCSETWADIAHWCWDHVLPKDPWQLSPGELCELNKADFK